MNVKLLFKTVLLTAILVLLLLLSWNNRAPADFNLLPVANERFHGPVALMGFVFFGIGTLMGLAMSIRTGRKPKASTEWTAEPPVGSRIS